MNSIIGKGRTAIVYQYGDSCALKLFNKGFEKMAEKEFKKTLILHRTGLPCPKVFKLLEQDGKKGIVYQCVKGESLFYHLKQCPFMVKKYAREMAQMHNKIHCYCGSELEEICIQLANQIRNAPDLSISDKKQIIEYMDCLPDGNQVCHMDYHPDNIMFEQGEISAVIDWSNSGRGNPLADVCRTSILLRAASSPPGTPLFWRMIIPVFGKVLNRLYLKAYCKQSGCTYYEISQWTLPIAAARLSEEIEKEREYLLNLIARHLKKIENQR